jgi:hypothetical protein
MGLFTTVVQDGIDYQFYAGQDNMERLVIGDAVPWYLDYLPGKGHLLDGAYGACFEKEEKIYWTSYVVIRDHRIFDIVAQKHDEETQDEIAARFGAKPPVRKWWTERAWDISGQMDKIAKERYENRLAKMLAENPGASELSIAMAMPIRWALDCVGTGRKILGLDAPDLDEDKWEMAFKELCGKLRDEPIPGQNPE